MANYFTGNGYGVSNLTDVTGRPLLTYQGPNDKKPFLLSDRVAQKFDFTTPQQLTAGAMKNPRLDSSVSNFIKTKLGGKKDDELDHKISLELGGSNAPANLMIQPGRTSGASAASDQLENSLALEVVAGRMSLLTAWRTLAEQKGFLLGEDSQIGTTFSFSGLASQIFYIAKSVATGAKGPALTQQAILLRSQMANDIEKLKQDPLNQKLQTKIFADNVTNLQNTTGMNQVEAATTTKTFLASYAQSKGIDPRELMGSLNANIQQIIENSKRNPNIFGIPSTAITKVVLVLQSISQLGIYTGLILTVIGIALVGPEAIVGALSGGLLESIGAIFGVSTLTGLGLTAFAVGEALSVAAIGLNMTTKQMYDNGYLLPTQNINALKDALAVQKGLAAFLPSQVTAPAATAAVTVAAPATKVFTGIISQGVLAEAPTFTPRENDLIESAEELKAAAQNNLAMFLTVLPGRVIYEIKLLTRVVLKDGTIRIGETQQVQTGTWKSGAPKYKTITNRFAVVNVYLLTAKAVRTKIDTIILGPVNILKYSPQTGQLDGITNDLHADLSTTKIADIPLTPAGTPAISQIAPPQVAAPAAVIAPTPAPQPTIQPTDLIKKAGETIDQFSARVNIPVATLKSVSNFPNTAYYDMPDFIANSFNFGQYPALATLAAGPAATPSAITIPPSNNPNKCSATTIAEFFDVNKTTYPTVAVRGTLYEAFGLGTASLYTGTSEQNVKLLAELKRRSGCTI